jgi:hypothetical protein
MSGSDGTFETTETASMQAFETCPRVPSGPLWHVALPAVIHTELTGTNSDLRCALIEDVFERDAPKQPVVNAAHNDEREGMEQRPCLTM